MVSLPNMISFAQNGEDVVLRRAFQGQKGGFYIDVGACHPAEDSVTHHFYDQGWRGINIEPDPQWFAMLRDARPEDVNIQAAVGNGGGTVPFFSTATRGHGTLDPTTAARRGAGEPQPVERLRLTDIVTAHAGGRTIDFLKVDVEGLEADVLASLDLARIRPRVILVEAVDEDGEPTHMSWEPSLLAGGYRFALFDGLNRFYCRAEEAEALLPLLAAPAYVLDNFRLAREVRAQAALSDRLDQEVAAHRACDVALQDERRLQAAALARSQAEALRLREAIEALKAAEREARHALEQVHASTSWRVTEPLRNAGRIVRLLRPRRTRA